MFDTPGQGGPGAPDNGNPGTPPAATPPGSTPPGAGGDGSDLFAGLFSDGSGTPPAAAPKPGDAPPATPPATPAATPPATPPASDKPAPKWLEQLPEEFRKHPALQDKESPADVLKDYLALKEAVADYKPVTNPAELNLKLPEGWDPNLVNQNGELDWLKKTAVEGKLSATQTQFVLEKFNEFRTMEWNHANKTGTEAIQSMWGKDFAANKDAVGKALNEIGLRLGPDGPQRLTAWVTGSPSVGSHPMFAEFMLAVAKGITPQSIPTGPGATPAQGPMSEAEYIKTVTGWQS